MFPTCFTYFLKKKYVYFNLPFLLNLPRTIQNQRLKLFVEMQFVCSAQSAKNSRDAT